MAKVVSAAFIGGGRVARILLEGWKVAGYEPARVVVVEPDEEALHLLRQVGPEITTAESGDVSDCELVFLAVHPPAMQEAMKSIAGKLAPQAVVVSLVPKIQCATIAEALGTEQVVRMIPNAPSAIGKGFNPVFFSAGIVPETKQELHALFAPWGEHPDVEEADLEAYAVISAMGPTYFWYQVQALRDLGVSFGLDPQATDEAVSKMLEGAVDCLLAKGPESMDLIPVRPLQELEPTVKEAYDSKLKGVFGKLTMSNPDSLRG